MPRIPSVLTILAALTTLASAHAQTPSNGATPPKPPVAPTKPSGGFKPNATPISGPVELLCRGLGQSTGATTNHQSVVTYERVTIRDTAGATRNIYAPVSAKITNGFSPAAEPVTARGERLTAGSCGVVASVITPVPGSPLLKLEMADPPTFALTSSTNRTTTGANLITHAPVVPLPECPSGVRRFKATRTSAKEFVVSLAATNATSCVE